MNNMNTNSNHKDVKLKEEILQVKEHLLRLALPSDPTIRTSNNKNTNSLHRNIPHISRNSEAVRIPIAALDQELKRMERDEKLRRKFISGMSTGSGTTTGVSSSGSSNGGMVDSTKSTRGGNSNSHTNTNTNMEDVEDDLVHVNVEVDPVEAFAGNGDSDACIDISGEKDWQQINRTNTDMTEENINTMQMNMNMNVSTSNGSKMEQTNSNDNGSDRNNNTGNTTESLSALGITLAQAAIADMAKTRTPVSTPTAALALVLHASLRTNAPLLDFKCTGVPDNLDCFMGDDEDDDIMDKGAREEGMKNAKKRKGFAPPIRELARGVFVPPQWDQYASTSTSAISSSSSSSGFGSGVTSEESSTFSRIFQSATGTGTGTQQSQTQCQEAMEKQRVLFRYSKIGMPTTILRVCTIGSSNSQEVRISFGPEKGEPTNITIPLDQHVNVEGLNLALHANASKSSKGVKPALYYKQLPELLECFCRVNDLGSVSGAGAGADSRSGDSDNGNNGGSAAVEAIAERYKAFSNGVPLPAPAPAPAPVPVPVPLNNTNGNTNARLYCGVRAPSNSHPRMPVSMEIQPPPPYPGMRPGGDFADDLMPSGIPLPGFAQPQPLGGPGIGPDIGGIGGGTGNLMGPNHPSFRAPPPDYGYDPNGYGDNGDFMTPGGLGMQPRFDPFYPPGVGGRGMPGRGRRGRGRGRGRGRFGNGRGDPNPDHLRPPNSFNNGNMFM